MKTEAAAVTGSIPMHGLRVLGFPVHRINPFAVGISTELLKEKLFIDNIFNEGKEKNIRATFLWTIHPAEKPAGKVHSQPHSWIWM